MAHISSHTAVLHVVVTCVVQLRTYIRMHAVMDVIHQCLLVSCTHRSHTPFTCVQTVQSWLPGDVHNIIIWRHAYVTTWGMLFTNNGFYEHTNCVKRWSSVIYTSHIHLIICKLHYTILYMYVYVQIYVFVMLYVNLCHNVGSWSNGTYSGTHEARSPDLCRHDLLCIHQYRCIALWCDM